MVRSSWRSRVVSEYVDLDDLPARDGEVEYHARLSAGGPYGSSGPVDECRFCGLGTPGEGISHGRRTADLVSSSIEFARHRFEPAGPGVSRRKPLGSSADVVDLAVT